LDPQKRVTHIIVWLRFLFLNHLKILWSDDKNQKKGKKKKKKNCL